MPERILTDKPSFALLGLPSFFPELPQKVEDLFYLSRFFLIFKKKGWNAIHETKVQNHKAEASIYGE